MKIDMNNYSKGNSAEHAILDLYKNLVEAIDKKKKKKENVLFSSVLERNLILIIKKNC